MSSTKVIIPNIENATVFKKHKHKKKKAKKEKKDKKKNKHVANFLTHYSLHEMLSTQTKKTKKAKKDLQYPKVRKQPKHLHQTQPIIYISPVQKKPQTIKNKCHKKHVGKEKKRVIFNLPPEQDQTSDDEYSKKQFIVESSLEYNIAEEMSSQDLFITQKSFLDPPVEISSSSSGNEAISTRPPEIRSCALTTEATTQTENFFTFPALSTSFRFQQQQNKSRCEEEPIDLSLPNRRRQKQTTINSANRTKISDTSSEEGEIASKTKGDVPHLKVIQTRLNECFYFKVKGEDSPKPLCPLMKLTESAEKRAKK
uniref:Si:ch211-176l24.4 n=1 Tax=Danio rerio TaxID=7955 RepID=A0A8M3AWJ5_DANRE|nr:uncharacterized protein si:ch211-176l24.4 [Danio rerio]XP_009296236.1 uncharacterized protein si:ch211-176l24.4 [Danio rerio]|eukprot:XP_001336486.1 uncharacterized protein si:ch211-176l24.4 [Danio rerio]